MTTVTRRAFVLGGLVVAGTGGGLLLPATASAAVGGWAEGEVIDCVGWGARPSSRAITVLPRKPTRIFVHHTATANTTDFSRTAATRLAHLIQDFHMDRRGWIDSGQNFTISRGGFVLEGRHHSLEVVRGGGHHAVGAHCTGQNEVAVGIENEGTYVAGEPPGAQWDSLRGLCALLCRQYGIAPAEIAGHRDFKDTACPGDGLYAMLPRLRSEVSAQLGQPLAIHMARRLSWPLLRPPDQGRRVLAAQHLLRAAGNAVPATGCFDQQTADAVTQYQLAHRTEFPNGMIGGETWPLLTGAEGANPADVATAAQALTPPGAATTESVPASPAAWQRLLARHDR